MELLHNYPDVELVAVALLEPLVSSPTAQVVTVLPEVLTLPTIQVQRTGGSDDRITDYATVQVKVFAGTRPDAWALAEQVRQTVLAARRTAAGGALIDNTDTVTPTVQMPDEGDDVRTVMAAYRFSMRRPRLVTSSATTTLSAASGFSATAS